MAQNKFLHEEEYRGKGYLEQLKNFHISICGTGALGSNLVDFLCRVGIKHIRAIDFDRVEAHNIGTQIFNDSDVGALKVAALSRHAFNLGVEIEAVSKELTGSNSRKLLNDSDLVVDTFDNSASRKVIQDECKKSQIPCIHAGLFADYGEVCWNETYKVPKDAEEGDACEYPLARGIVILTVTVLAEEVLDFALQEKPRKKNWSITLKDLAIREKP